MIVIGSENQNDLGSVWQSWGGVWGPSDAIHFEYPGFSAPSGAVSQSTAESILSIPAPLSLTVAQLLAEAFPDLDPSLSYALLHPWTGMDDFLPQFLLDWRMKILGV